MFELGKNGLVLLEIAAGLDVKSDVLNRIPFPVEVAEKLKVMDKKIFTFEKMGLAQVF